MKKFSIFFALMATALLVLGAGTVMAEMEYKVGGDMNASFGSRSGDADPEYISGNEMRLWWDAKDGKLSGRFWLRYRGSADDEPEATDAASAVRGHVTWEPMDNLEVRFHGRSLGVEGASEFAKIYNVRNDFANRDADDGIDIRDASGISVGYSMGKALNVALYIMDECEPACMDGALDTDVITDSTTVVAFHGRSGPMRYFLYSGTGAAKAASNDASVGSTMMQAGFQYKTKAFSAALDYSSSSWNLDDTSTDLYERGGVGIGAEFMGIGFYNFTRTDSKAGVESDKRTVNALVYGIKTGEKSLVSIEYRSEARDRPGKASTADSVILIGGKVRF